MVPWWLFRGFNRATRTKVANLKRHRNTLREPTMHIITLSFDDGFKKSNLEIARIYEQRNLKANFNVVAAPLSMQTPDPTRIHVEVGDFTLWNEMQARGHDIQPHSYTHANLSEYSFEDGRARILKCLDIFDEQLDGFDRAKSIYHFAFNRTTPELEAWLPTVVRAFRGGHVHNGINPLPTKATRVLRTTGFGPANCEAHLDTCIDDLLTQPSGWLMYNTHGLDEEGWGPIGSAYLPRLLDRLMAIDTVRLMPTGEVFRRIDAGESL